MRTDNLTDTEREYLEEILKGKSDQQIAVERSIELATSRRHAHNIYKKTGLSRLELIAESQKKLIKIKVDHLDSIGQQIENITKLREQGDYKQAIEEADPLLRTTEGLLLGEYLSDTQSLNKLKGDFSRLLHLKGVCEREYLPPSGIVLSTQNLPWYIIKDYEGVNFFKLDVGDAYFITGSNREAAKFLRPAVRDLFDTENKALLQDKFLTQDKLWATRIFLYVLADLGGKEEFDSYKAKMDSLISQNDISPSLLCQTYEGIARAEAKLNLASAESTIHKAWHYGLRAERELHHPLMRLIQVGRTVYEVHEALGLGVPDTENMRIVLKGETYAKDLNSTRHIRQYENHQKHLQ